MPRDPQPYRWRSWNLDLCVPSISQEGTVPPGYSPGLGRREGCICTREEVEGLHTPGTYSSLFPSIVQKVRAIPFNQEQVEELMHRPLSMTLMESGSSIDLQNIAKKQDLFSALVSRAKVCFLSCI